MVSDDPIEGDDRASDELVGPGGYPLRIQPAAAIMPGRADAQRLLALWFVRKSFYWLFLGGLAFALTVLTVRGEEPDNEISLTDPTAAIGDLTTPWAFMIVALILRFVVGWVALALAFPLALAHEPGLSPRTNFGSGIGRFFDRLHVARALRSTHHVRQVAQHRLGERGRRVGRLDPILDTVNISAGAAVIVAPVIAGLIIG